MNQRKLCDASKWKTAGGSYHRLNPAASEEEKKISGKIHVQERHISCAVDEQTLTDVDTRYRLSLLRASEAPLPLSGIPPEMVLHPDAENYNPEDNQSLIVTSLTASVFIGCRPLRSSADDTVRSGPDGGQPPLLNQIQTHHPTTRQLLHVHRALPSHPWSLMEPQMP